MVILTSDIQKFLKGVSSKLNIKTKNMAGKTKKIKIKPPKIKDRNIKTKLVKLIPKHVRKLYP
jgi:hypothetical protein